MSTRILYSLTETEWKTFFPGPLRDEVLAIADESKSIDPLTISGDGWRDLLGDFKPAIMVSGWKTPAIPGDVEDLTSGAFRYFCYLAGSVKKQVTLKHIESGITVSNWGGVISRTVAEQGLMLAVATLRRANYWALSMHNEGAWKTPETIFHSLFERRVGVHGFGHIAREFVRLLKPFDCQVSTYSPSVPDSLLERHGVARSQTLEDLFSNHEVIIELAALTPRTEGIVTEKLLRMIPEGGVFVNIGRGAVVDEVALAKVAGEGRIHVGLDVFGEEPLPEDSPFRGNKNVMLMPHLGGPTTDRRQDSGRLAIANLRRFIAGESLEAVITPEIFMRAT